MPWLRRSREPQRGVTVDVIEWGAIELGHFRCRPESPAWREDNQIGEGPLLVVPHRAVEIAQAGADTVIASPAQAVFYSHHQIYRRRLIDPRGDDCVYVRLPGATWARLLGRELDRAIDDGSSQPPFTRGPIKPAFYRCFEQLLLDLHHGALHERLAFEERLLLLVDALVTDAATASERRRQQPRHHARLGLAAEALVAARFDKNWGLDDLASELAVSPAHLSRIFRRHAGVTIHQHRIRLRLAAALELVADPRRSLTQIALELGFASSSHFSSQFRLHLGLPPSAVRGAGARRRQDLSKSLRARAGI